MFGMQSRIAPAATSAQAGAFAHREQFQKAPPDENGPGALFEPDYDGTEAKDEWSESGKYVDPAVVGLAAIIPFVGGIWWWKRSRARRNREEEVQGVA